MDREIRLRADAAWEPDWDDFERLVTQKTKVVAFGAGCNALGTVNLLHEAGWYDERDVPVAMAFAALAVPGYLELLQHAARARR